MKVNFDACRLLLLLSCLTNLCAMDLQAAVPRGANLESPKVGDHVLNIITPTLIELLRINSKQPDPAGVEGWDWVNGQGNFTPPDLTSIRVVVNGETNEVVAVGFKRRPIYAPLDYWDLRIASQLYLQLSVPISEGQTVEVINDGTAWPTNLPFVALADPLRFSPAIHVNQEGYLPMLPKKALVGYYAGSLGEVAIASTNFSLLDAQSGAPVFQGMLTLRSDVGFSFEPAQYQNVWQADFTAFTNSGQFRVAVPGMGVSLPFWIDDGVGMVFARTYALGLLHQRSGFDVAMPFTRFTHAADHTAPAVIPLNDSGQNVFTWTTISNYASFTNLDNPSQTAPRLTSPSAQLYPFVNTGPIDVSGGHFEAANYSKPAWNSSSLIHIMMFAVDAFPGVADLDNLGIPESGDGISDVMQEAKWEADFLVRMQDADGGFYYMIHPVDREYEYDVLPENGDPQIIWPKNTATTAAAVAALVQCASSPRFKQAYPAAASNYMVKAQLGWQFLTNAIATHGKAGAYQRIMHFDDAFTHDDDLAWAACELFLATGDPQYHALLKSWCPDPTDPTTMRWGWWKMYAAYGNLIRSYAAAVRSGRLQTDQIDAAYMEKCVEAITACADDTLRWSQESAYGSSYPEPSKSIGKAGWYYSTEQAFDLVVAQEFNPKPEYVEAILQNLNFEAGCNPVNVSYVTGLGWKRQKFVVDQYSANDRRVLPKIGVPIGNIQEGFVWTWLYGGELTALTYPYDWAETGSFAFYDRWCDFWNVSTEASTANTVRSFATALWLASQTSLAAQPWTFTNANLVGPTSPRQIGQPVTISLQCADTNLAGARIIWEALGQEPVFGDSSYTFTPAAGEGDQWVEAEVQWADGRRAFATGSILVSSNAPPELVQFSHDATSGVSFQLIGVPLAPYRIQISTNLLDWEDSATNVLPASGVLEVNDAESNHAVRFYRAVRMP